MDVYSQKEQRAHGTGFVGIEAESDDQIDNLEVYEALINPREAEPSTDSVGMSCASAAFNSARACARCP